MADALGIESGDLDGMLACYDDSAVQGELPNRLKPAGDRRTMPDLRRAGREAASEPVLRHRVLLGAGGSGRGGGALEGAAGSAGGLLRSRRRDAGAQRDLL